MKGAKGMGVTLFQPKPEKLQMRRDRHGEAIVFYYSRRPANGRSAIALQDGRIVYVRAELHNCDCVTALDRAEPQADETVLNAVDI